jgi:hypothetical protein
MVSRNANLDSLASVSLSEFDLLLAAVPLPLAVGLAATAIIGLPEPVGIVGGSLPSITLVAYAIARLSRRQPPTAGGGGHRGVAGSSS